MKNSLSLIRLICLGAIGYFLMILLFACSAHRGSRIAPPVAALDIPFEKIRFQADSGAQIRLSSGTQIRIEPGSLIDANGNLVRGEVEFRVREFHTTNDILRSGIPLNTQRASSDRLQSAGMIEMRAFANEQALEVASGKTIGVDLAGYRNSTGYDLWFMEGDDSWNLRGNFQPDSNRSKIEAIRTLSDSLKKPRSPQEEEDRTFELVGNITEIPYLKPYAGMKWRLDDSEKIEVLGIQGRVHWENVRINKVKNRQQVYALTFTQFDRGEGASLTGIKKTILASPLTSRGDMKKRMKEYEEEVAEIDRKRKERLEQLAKSQKEADLLQFFAADRLGIWNVDRLMKMEDCTPVIVHFDFEKDAKGEEGGGGVIALYDAENSVMQFKRDGGDKQIYLQKGKDMRLIAFLPKERIALVDNATIQQALGTGAKEVTLRTSRMSLKDFLMPQP